jgi:hypothetical protein
MSAARDGWLGFCAACVRLTKEDVTQNAAAPKAAMNKRVFT